MHKKVPQDCNFHWVTKILPTKGHQNKYIAKKRDHELLLNYNIIVASWRPKPSLSYMAFTKNNMCVLATWSVCLRRRFSSPGVETGKPATRYPRLRDKILEPIPCKLYQKKTCRTEWNIHHACWYTCNSSELSMFIVMMSELCFCCKIKWDFQTTRLLSTYQVPASLL